MVILLSKEKDVSPLFCRHTSPDFQCYRVFQRLTVELTGRREFIQPAPDESSYKTRPRRSRPTICWAGRGSYFDPAKNQRLPDGSFTAAASNSSSPSPQGRSEGSMIVV